MFLINLEYILLWVLFETIDFIYHIVYPFYVILKAILISVKFVLVKILKLIILIFYYIPKKLYSYKKYLTPFMKEFIVSPIVYLFYSIHSELQDLSVKFSLYDFGNKVYQLSLNKVYINKISYCIVKKVN